MSLEALAISDWSGGITDFVVGREPTKSQELFNFIIGEDKKLLTRPGSVVVGGSNDQIKSMSGLRHIIAPLGNDTDPYRIHLKTSGMLDSGKGAIFTYNDGSYQTELLGPGGKHLFDHLHAAATDTRVFTSTWIEHHFLNSASLTQKLSKVYKDDQGDLQLRSAGLPDFPHNQANPTSSMAGSTASYVYAFVWKVSYKVKDRTFITRSQTFRWQVGTSAAIGGTTHTISNLPVFPSTSGHYDLDNADASLRVKLEVYRTTHNGTVYYYVGEIDAKDTTDNFADNTSDANLVKNVMGYFNGGVIDNGEPPISKFFHITERGIGYYGYIKEPNGSGGYDVLKNRVRQSVPGTPESAPPFFFDEADEEITGISSFKGVPIFFTLTSVYRGDGVYQRSGPGALQLTRIDTESGCVSHASIVQTSKGVFFASQSGFYWTDGYQVRNVSSEIKDSYARVYRTQAVKENIKGVTDSENLVYWTFSDPDLGTHSDGAFVAHLNHNSEKGPAFTTIGGNSAQTLLDSFAITGEQANALPAQMLTNFRMKDLLHWNGSVYRADDRGYVFRFSKDVKTDPRVDDSAPPSSWGTTHILYKSKTPALNFGTDFIRKWTPRIVVHTRNRGDISLQAFSERDLTGLLQPIREIKKRGSFTWGMPGVLWGDPIMFSGDKALFADTRRLPTPGIRCSYRSILLTNSFTIIASSDHYVKNGEPSLVAVNSTTHTAQFTDGNLWPSDSLDYFISFANDGYLRKFMIKAISGDTITFADPDGFAPDGEFAWQLHGWEKGNIASVESLSILYQYLTDTQTPFRKSMGGGNA